ncbi:uncharacterized protein LOC101860260 [Aplysia californica]|uniref:Uncharacterized protein LOC101860260 n=1 Tax=Aplysia californica TaxID=6500 RepID=A0ABM0JU60_APLCA|nr:uncharacterized protein LOC101860260 [Aplysia californica]
MTVKSILRMCALPFTSSMQIIEALLFMLVRWYDDYLYSPLQTALWPVVELVPRTLDVDGYRINIFTANIVSWSRTLLVVPIAMSLKYQFYWTGFWLVILHDFLDHLDGIVAKVQRQKYGPVDDPILGGFMDAFCDKIVNVLSLWSILMVTNFSTMTWTQMSVYITACGIIIVYEFILGVVRVQDFFRAYYLRKFNKVDVGSSKANTAAIMEGKLKEKLESLGIAALCVAQSAPMALLSVSGVLGITSLYLSVRLAHSSLTNKLWARAAHMRSQAHASEDEDELKSSGGEHEDEKTMASSGSQTDSYEDGGFKVLARQSSVFEEKYEESNVEAYPTSGVELDNMTLSQGLHRSFSMPGTELFPDSHLDSRVERVYTIGCFDLFHHGHVTLLNRMRTFGKKVIVGVHDSRSIYQLKKRVPIDSTVTRMRNVKRHADEVFCVAGTDPTSFIDNIFDRSMTGSAIYVRGDDMPDFPARKLCESLMTVKFLPYTPGVSSTKLRKDLFNACHCDVRLDDGYADLLFY